ncbi:hypothetical protein [Catenuloplanes japonicus]|nr:hypothetical protein [Catenuloplanes japonicus]
MKRIPAFWSVAYDSRRPVPVRLLARAVVHMISFFTRLAVSDHRPFVSL